jgi:hypothetical protein
MLGSVFVSRHSSGARQLRQRLSDPRLVRPRALVWTMLMKPSLGLAYAPERSPEPSARDSWCPRMGSPQQDS